MSDLDLFASAGDPVPRRELRPDVQLARLPADRGESRSASRHAEDIARLVPLARELATRSDRVTASDLRIVAVQRGLLTGEERGKTLSYLPAVLRAAGLKPTGEFIRYPIPRTHGNVMAVWRAA